MKPKDQEDQDQVALPVPTPDGVFLARYSPAGLSGLEFPSSQTSAHVTNRPIPLQVRDWHRLTANALERALAGNEPDRLPPLDLSRGTAFQQRVWSAMRAIPAGQTSTYAGIALAIGNPRATRAVGSACGANPIPVFVPCHRVLASHGLGGFSGDFNWKLRLLEREARTGGAPRVVHPG